MKTHKIPNVLKYFDPQDWEGWPEPTNRLQLVITKYPQATRTCHQLYWTRVRAVIRVAREAALFWNNGVAPDDLQEQLLEAAHEALARLSLR